MRCEVWGVKCELWGVRCEVWVVRCEVWGVRCEVWGVRCELWGVRCEVWSVKCEVWGVRCEVWGASHCVRQITGGEAGASKTIRQYKTIYYITLQYPHTSFSPAPHFFSNLWSNIHINEANFCRKLTSILLRFLEKSCLSNVFKF